MAQLGSVVLGRIDSKAMQAGAVGRGTVAARRVAEKIGMTVESDVVSADLPYLLHSTHRP
jgi:hypothetical protein